MNDTDRATADAGRAEDPVSFRQATDGAHTCVPDEEEAK